MTAADANRPRHARAEIRAFAKWLRSTGWNYERNDAKGHTLWSHPQASGPYKLPETPSRFNVRLARRDVLALLGKKPEGKRNATAARKGGEAPDPEVEASRRRYQRVHDAKLEAMRAERERRQRALVEADAIAASDRRRREIEALMRPGR